MNTTDIQKTATVLFNYGQVTSFEDLAPNSIALDGAVQGPRVDAANRRFSFDHHDNCERMLTLATCQQVAVALKLGLVVDCNTVILTNDVDADTVLSVWLLLNPLRVGEPKVEELVERIGLTDAHGPTMGTHPFHSVLELPRDFAKSEATLETLMEYVAKVDSYVDGTWQAPEASEEKALEAIAFSVELGWHRVQEGLTFGSMYDNGRLACVMQFNPGNYLVAKRSDLVPLAIGPGVKAGTERADGDYADTLIGFLARKEIEVNPDQSHTSNWGGGTSVGGAPRNEDGGNSKLSLEDILELAKEVCTL